MSFLAIDLFKLNIAPKPIRSPTKIDMNVSNQANSCRLSASYVPSIEGNEQMVNEHMKEHENQPKTLVQIRQFSGYYRPDNTLFCYT